MITLQLPVAIAQGALEEIATLPELPALTVVKELIRQAMLLRESTTEFTDRDVDEALRTMGLRGPLEGA